MANQSSPAQRNADFINRALQKNWSMPTIPVTAPGQVLDIELDSVAGYAYAIDLSVQLDIKVTAGATPTAPTVSQFAPWNIFSEVQVSLGGGPFQRVNPYFYFLKELIQDEYFPGTSENNVPYASSIYSVPTPTVTASASTDTTWKFNIKIPLQSQFGTTVGLLPLGSGAVKAKLRLTVNPNLYGTDTYLNALNGGTNITGVSIGSAVSSFVQPNILFFTSPATKNDVPDPTIGYVLNVQERSTPINALGVNVPIKYSDPFQYMRLYHIILDGSGNPNSLNVTNFELDLLPSFPQFQYNTPQAIQHYWNEKRRLYGSDLPVGAFIFDMVSGSDPQNPNGHSQMIDASIFQTMQTQVQVGTGFATGSSARIITYAEALAPVNF